MGITTQSKARLYTSPITRLPKSVLTKIFKLCDEPYFFESKAPGVLSHVCRYWRHLALTTPELWTVISLRVPAEKLRGQQIRTDTFSRRSQNLPISIYLNVYSPTFSHHDVRLALQPLQHRVRELTVRACPKICAEQVFAALQGNVPQRYPLLELFDLRIQDGMQFSFSRKVSSGVLCPHISFPFGNSVVWSTWIAGNLTHLTLKYTSCVQGTQFPIRVLRDILSANKRTLQHLEIYDSPLNAIEQNDDDDALLLPVLLPKLQSLSIGYTRAASLVSITDSLHAPNLESLSVRDYGRCPDASTPTVLCGTRCFRDDRDGVLDLLTSLSRFTNISTLSLHGVTPKPYALRPDCPVLDSFRLDSLTLIHSDNVFDCLFHPISTPNTTDSDEPYLTLTGTSLSQLTLTSLWHSPFSTYLELRLEADLPPLDKLVISPGSIHSDFLTTPESLWPDLINEAGGDIAKRLDWIERAAYTVRLIPQPLDGVRENLKECDPSGWEDAWDLLPLVWWSESTPR
ncbi:hypothetical protein SERLA73DRAFT_75264 [Serpula lacrymans var. lacrymans S7.3]|uniref:F-box domain-containing protein n=2 Tax=Serpula lacrymans var. lacrymans TaxID=341189 RepID=F8Q338_SERL3|nr:uncharacterized protein SERLADRAFT_439937 [Serpula lacrymans var. lacrymans S7.9]EGN97599.1 hypothetical protein SERLA73DRAFT_75264 [Serpula lacrymans var. lacrymans S7.3]EGO23191.1 hypothetical protein SERLADRAFT_439937 [Serpula lacrymans var. lacrymans S7.9]